MMKPIALTMGDPSGIAPEITAKAWEALRETHPFALIGSAEAIRRQAPDTPLEQIEAFEQTVAVMPRALPVMDMDLVTEPVPGTPALANAPAVIASIEKAVHLVAEGDAAAVVTNPISKQVLIDGADFAYPGHTEFLAHLGGREKSVMMLVAPGLRVVPVTIHIPLSKVPTELSAELLSDTIRKTHAALISDFAIPAPRIAVAGLNPHAGEGGKMGEEEATLIIPVLDRLRADGLNIDGPLPADTMFHPPARARYDVAVCMYHDQALIPIKTLDFAGGVNCTLGLPFVRTSPDHGTAFGIAGQGIADADSLIAAIRCAVRMVRNRGAQ